ncbi:MAG: hypothetical protein OEL83_09120 [Desulforhopalus sp.]|nr:hypothetical protein [Desulforhopalus sp.]
MVKPARKSSDWLTALISTAGLHLLIILVAALPSSYYFSPLAEVVIAGGGMMEESSLAGENTGDRGAATGQAMAINEKESPDPGGVAIPYQHAVRQRTQAFALSDAGRAIPEVLRPVFSGGGDFRSLARQEPVKRLVPPRFSSSTIPPRPDKSLEQAVDEDAEAVLLGNVFDNAVPATATSKDFLLAEAQFRRNLHRDIADGRLDMPFADFIIAAEFFHLSRALLPLGQQPAFSLEEAMARYTDRLRRVGEGLPKEIDGYSLIMVLQRYAENKFYPGNGSGMLLDSLFHFQNDCEGGTKEIIAYLQALYPALQLGSNRGMLQTTTGELIGHMQAFIGPGPDTGKIIANDRGLIVETTRVSFDSVLPYQAGDVFPLEDFVVRYYPDIAADSPLAAALAARDGGSGEGGKRIVGTSDSPLKMGYGATATLLAGKLYDLDAIRTQRIANEFLKSDIPSCNPRIDPARIDRTNLFSNFVTIDRKLRKNLIGHYLADLQYWDNQVMPEWRMPDYLATYEDLAGSLLNEKGGAAGLVPQGHEFRLNRQDAQFGFIQVDAENSLPLSSLQSHTRLLRRLQTDAKLDRDRHLGAGRQECSGRAVLDDRLLGYLFKAPEGPGLYFLPGPGEDFSWPDFQENILNDCLAMPVAGAERTLLGILEDDASRQGSSLRRELYRQARSRGLTGAGGEDRLPATAAVLAGMVAGTADEAVAEILAGRHSPASTTAEPSVRETIAELGRTGFSSGLVWDIADFLGPEKLRGLILLYGKRGDLRLSVARAHELIAQLASTLGGGLAMEYLAELQAGVGDGTLRLAVDLNLAKLQNRPSSEISRIALDYLKGSGPLRAETLLALVQYGLAGDEAKVFLHGRLSQLLPQIAKPAAVQGAPAAEEVFVELVEMVKILRQLPDQKLWATLNLSLRDSLLADFTGIPAARDGKKAMADYGLIFNKLTVLAFLHERVGGEEYRDTGMPLSWIKQFVRFAGEQPIGKLMLAPVAKIVGDESHVSAMAGIISEQMALLNQLATGAGQQSAAGRVSGDAAGALRVAKTVLGDANVVARMLVSATASQVARISGFPAEQFAGNDGSKASWYLERLHRRIAPMVSGAAGVAGLAGKAQELRLDPAAWSEPVATYYLDDRVRESFALLAYFQGSGDGGGIKFTRNQDLAAIKDPSKLRIVERERKITRQDMSLLTLALNSTNDPSALRRTWEQTLAATGKHLGLPALDQGLRNYLFAPHHPYLTENDQGFFYSPETVEDLHNAAEWGGRNDILLSSYLHFRNLPGQLPDWLRRTAMARSELELKIIKKLEQQTFLPMILECDADKKELPDPLFRAKWEIRKPFGEDIFPGTLLLLRLGYLEITATGEIVRTAKYAGG